MFGEEAAAIFLGEHAVEAPHLIGKGADVENVHNQQVARLGALDGNRAAEVMHFAQVNIAHVFGTVVIADLAARPVHALDNKVRAGLDRCHHGHVRVPAVMDVVVLLRALAQVDLDQCFCHDSESSAWVMSRVRG